MHFFLAITHPNEETAGDRRRMLHIVQEGSQHIARFAGGSEGLSNPHFCLVLQALLTLPKLLLQLCEVELTY